MEPQWIPAAKALAAVAAFSDSFSSQMAICSRANAGLIRSTARLLIVDDDRAEYAIIPAEFWWAKGHMALVQDWITGNFSTFINRDIECRAFDVRFDLDGLRDMLPPDQAALMVRRLSVFDNPEWFTAKEARAAVQAKTNVNPEVAGALLLEQCRLGLVAARSSLMQESSKEKIEDPEHERREWDVPDWFWANFVSNGSSAQNWEMNLFSGRGQAPNGRLWIQLRGVHFARASIDAMIPASASPLATQTQAPPMSGRPPAAFWDDLHCAIFKDMFSGDFKPKTQAEIERRMLDWASTFGHELSSTAAKQRARKLFDAYQA